MEFKKITFPKGNQFPQVETHRSQAADRILADREVQDFLAHHDVDHQILEGNYGVFLRFLELKDGTDKDTIPDGYEIGLELQGGQDVCLVYKKKSWLLEYELRDENYVLRDFPIEWLRFNLSDTSVAKTDDRNLFFKECLRCLKGHAMPGIYLHGKSGIGKSYLMALMCNEAAIQNKKIAFVQVRPLFDKLRTYLFEKKNTEYEALKNLLYEADYLVLDDIGGERITEWSKGEALYDLLDARNRLGKLTNYTSNYSMDELIQLYGGDSLKNRRLVNHLRNSAKEVELFGLNYRVFAKEGFK